MNFLEKSNFQIFPVLPATINEEILQITAKTNTAPSQTSPPQQMWVVKVSLNVYSFCMFSSTNGREYSYTLKQRRKKNIIFFFLYVLIIFTIVSFINKFLIFPVLVRSDTMQPTISKNEVVFVSPLARPLSKDDERTPVFSSIFHSMKLKRSDLVLVKPIDTSKIQDASFLTKIGDSFMRFISFQQYSPLTSTAFVSGNSCIRRIVGIPGDTIYMNDNVLYVKSKGEIHFLTEFEVSTEDYNVKIDGFPENWDRNASFSGNYEEIFLKDGEYFLLADNRSSSVDSRYWGVVKSNQIAGKVLSRYWPLNKISFF